ncbi:fungal-specific transcription factor domain-containing protein [Hygrophoropsis aurantiaca]|uniref:Fungal-specific transcription factor domain-containing protein n=1 Tax=Hygrophoropsis aurantiaca TaxID=72124 RepID=A0ACB8A6K6_9AGAM|nr:fungal-specific transcription factor domain-containing protein [Hygrophoropsis aurantiaca]
MESSSRDPKSNDSQPVPQQPISSSTAKPTRKPRQKKQADDPKPSRPAAESSSSSRRPPSRRESTGNSTSQPTAADLQEAARQNALRGPTLQPYPGPVPYMMNNYPIHPSPFTQHPSGASYGSPGTMNGASGPGMPGQYYPMHQSPYPPPPHGYAPYHQYPQQMMMYGHPPRNPSLPEQPQPASAPSPVQAPPSSSTGKRKRKVDGGRGKAIADRDSDQEGPSGSDIAGKQSTPAASTPTAAEMKKRTKTQRACDSCRSRKIRCDVLIDSEPPLCQHCKQYGFECTFFLPITETRFKKKKLEEEAAEKEKEKSADLARNNTSSPQTDSQKADRRVYGPTTAVHLLHSQATISARVYESYDQRYQHTWEVTNSGDGVITVQNVTEDEKQISHPKPIDLRIEPEVVQNLVNAYFKDIAPILPVVTQAEFVANPSPSPILLYSMCLVAAARREVPQSVFDSIRYAVNSVIKSDDVLSTASIANVQALLILSMVGDSHSQYVPNALSALWIRLGTAIRMAQDLGLHRAESVKQDIELRRRLWGACVICDRWISLTYGHPYMIDVQDCDARLPSSGDPNDLYMDELVRLSVILGRVLKTIYSPSGLMFTTDDMLNTLLTDLENWKTHLPESLQYRGPDTPQNAGLLHLLYSTVCMIFWRVFMRISYSCPAHLKFGLTVETWSALVTLTGESIDWLDAHERMYDVWLLVAYSATSCALVQYHTWARRQDADAAANLRRLRDCVRRWEGSISPDHMSARRKTAEIISLLYESTQGRQPLGGLEYKKDPSRPGGGVFVAHGEARGGDYQGIPQGTIITSSDDESEAINDLRNQRGSSLVTITPLPGSGTGAGGGGEGGGVLNMNPALNKGQTPGNVQVLNMLDVPQASGTLQQFAMADVGLLEGIPGGMFDWGMCSSLFRMASVLLLFISIASFPISFLFQTSLAFILHALGYPRLRI